MSDIGQDHETIGKLIAKAVDREVTITERPEEKGGGRY